MSIDITFTLKDEDLKRFEEIVGRARVKVEDDAQARQIEEAAMALVEKARTTDLPGFIEERLLKLEILLNMIQDQEWQLADEERKAIQGALAYFCDSEDLIPDHIPGIGYLDDALYAEIIFQELDSEVRTYNEFCQFRIAEENRRRNRGVDAHVGREDWLADKRSVLHSRMRARRAARVSGGGWRTRLF